MIGFEWESLGGHRLPPVSVIVEDAARERALEAVRLAGAPVGEVVGWRALADPPAGLWAGPVLAEAEGVADEVLAAGLPVLATAARDRATPVVVALAPDQIDQVAAALFGPGVDLLCDATVADRVGALVLAGAGRPGGVAENDGGTRAAQLRKLGEDVARIAGALAELAQRDDRGGGVGDRTSGYGAEPSDEEEADPVSLAEVRAAIRARRMRDAAFGPGWFEDPAWDMLLDLFAAELEEQRVSVSSLCIAAAVAPTTALRWITRMTEAGLLERRPDPLDRRRAFMVLTPLSRGAMLRHAAALKRAGLAFA